MEAHTNQPSELVNGLRSALLRVQADRRAQRVNVLTALGGGFGCDAELAPFSTRAKRGIISTLRVA
ncbi:hypothetical protein WKW80_23985 [Variovorax humicola]|uniref:Uncharacterized protein n=1 Tax=Variovorax humicola TaxID=1769758 RepID=A0ABU8W4U0_9BURK